MAHLLSACCKVYFLILFLSVQLLSVHSVKFQVGDDKGWVVPSSNDDQIYNQWASQNRFQVGDSINFKYQKDSVLVVTDSEYDKCDSAHPLFFSNNGDTVYQLDRPGLFYFISGMDGHCERGQKMIIKVLEPQSTPVVNNTVSSPPTSSAAAGISSITRVTPLVLLLLSGLGRCNS